MADRRKRTGNKKRARWEMTCNLQGPPSDILVHGKHLFYSFNIGTHLSEIGLLLNVAALTLC